MAEQMTRRDIETLVDDNPDARIALFSDAFTMYATITQDEVIGMLARIGDDIEMRVEAHYLKNTSDPTLYLGG